MSNSYFTLSQHQRDFLADVYIHDGISHPDKLIVETILENNEYGQITKSFLNKIKYDWYNILTE